MRVLICVEFNYHDGQKQKKNVKREIVKLNEDLKSIRNRKNSFHVTSSLFIRFSINFVEQNENGR